MEQYQAMLLRSLDGFDAIVKMREKRVQDIRERISRSRINEGSEESSLEEEEFNPDKPSTSISGKLEENFVHSPSFEPPFGRALSSADSIRYSLDVPDCGRPVTSRRTEGSSFQPWQAAGLLNGIGSSFLDSLSFCGRQVAPFRANDIKPLEATEGLREQNNNPFKLESISRSVDGLASHPRSRNPSGRDREECDDWEVPNPECERDSEESFGEGNEEESRRTIYPLNTIAAAVTRNYEGQKPSNFSSLNKSPYEPTGPAVRQKIRGSAMGHGSRGPAVRHGAGESAMVRGAKRSAMLYGSRGYTMGEEPLGTTAMPSSADAHPMSGPPPAYHTSSFPGMPGLPIPVSSFMERGQTPSISPPPITSEAIARALAASRVPPKPRGEKKPIPNEQKDTRYYERRKKNNAAAKKSRDARKKREDEVAKKADFLEQESEFLRREILRLKSQINSMFPVPVEKGLPLISMLNLASQSQFNFNAIVEQIKAYRESLTAEDKINDED